MVSRSSGSRCRPPGRSGSERAKEAGLAGQVDIRLQDYRDVDDGPFDAISSIGMFEHVGRGGCAATSPICSSCCARGPAAQPRHLPAARRHDALPSRSRRRRWLGGRSSTASSSPTGAARARAPCSPRCSSRASRSVTARRCGSTTGSPCGPGSPTSRPTGTRPCGWPGSAGPGCGASTWRPAPSASRSADPDPPGAGQPDRGRAQRLPVAARLLTPAPWPSRPTSR